MNRALLHAAALLASLLLAHPALAATASAPFTVTIGAAAGQTIASITPSSATVNTAPCADGMLVTALTATMAPASPAFAGTWSVSGDTHFRISGSSLVCNGSVPASVTPYTPTVTATPTSGAIAPKSQVVSVTVQGVVTGCTPAGSPCPVGATAPAGFHFNLVHDDEFTQQTAIDTSFWYECNVAPAPCAFDSRGLVVDTTVSTFDCETVGQGTGCISGVGSINPQRFGFWEWYMKSPSDVNGEGDGYHIDTYINNNGDPNRPFYQEIDMNETVLGIQNQNTMQWTFDGNQAIFDAGVPTGGNFHTYGLMWVNDGVDNGTNTGFFDGSVYFGPGRASDSATWGTGGAVIIMGSMRNCDAPSAVFAGGSPCGSNTVAHGNPTIYRYFRLWQIVPN